MLLCSCQWCCAGKQRGLSDPIPDSAGPRLTQVSAKLRLLLTVTLAGVICSIPPAVCRQHHRGQLLGLSCTAEPAAEEQSLMCSRKCLLVCHDVRHCETRLRGYTLVAAQLAVMDHACHLYLHWSKSSEVVQQCDSNCDRGMQHI